MTKLQTHAPKPDPPSLETRQVIALESIAASLKRLTKAVVRTPCHDGKEYAQIEITGSIGTDG